MTQPAFAVVCDNCLESAADWYAIGERWICAGCWDPFGEFDHVSERRSRVRVDGVAHDMLVHRQSGPANAETLTGPSRSTSTASTGGIGL